MKKNVKSLFNCDMFLLCVLILEFVVFGMKNQKFLMPRVLLASEIGRAHV